MLSKMISCVLAQGISQQELARFLGVSQSTVCRMASGKIKSIKSQPMERLKKIIRVSSGEKPLLASEKNNG